MTPDEVPVVPATEPTPEVPVNAVVEPAAPLVEPTLNEPPAVLEGKEESVTGKDPWVGNHKVAE